MGHRVTVRFYKQVNVNNISRLEQIDGQPSYHDTIVSEARKLVTKNLIDGDRTMSCYLYWLPIEVRCKIYEAIFVHDGSPLEIGRLVRTGIDKLAILRTSHLIYHEASIALYHSLSYRKLFIRAYGAFTVDLLTRRPTPLRCCRRFKAYDPHLENPCRNRELNWSRPLGAVVFLIGAENPKWALHRRRAFSEFITSLQMTEPLRIYSLTVITTENWNLPGFDEKNLVEALFNGAFKFLGRLKFRGFTENERSRLSQLVHGRRIPTLKIERNKTKIQGPGFSIWICKCLFSLFSILYALKHQIYYCEENIPIRINILKSKSNDKKTLFIRRFRHNGTSYLTSIQLTNCVMSRNPAS
ncbi:hypothetical protein BDV29DRAFT_172022 [Aspergillus leporis]|jgi:hypothetical protein|uniref:Uncharacterized protein n=1 Tax=Aspergillus leporis TaxID=41062 RepID=A0A5N5X4A0_9EURO|nr:hypothetical protein BDV29DRAFT_172022 [Aspergillus leporis]